MTCHILDQEELLALSILEIILMETDASPLKLSFLKSGLCTEANTYIDGDNSEVPVLFLLKGCNPESADKLEQLMRHTLEEIVSTGISLPAIEDAMHQLEFFRSEITGDHAPFGLSLFMRSALLKQHSANPEDGLKIHSLFDSLRRHHLAEPHYFTQLIKKHFLDNTHLVRITMQPSSALAEQELQEERSTLSSIRAQLSENQVQEIIERTAKLAAFQKDQEEEDPDILPKITLDDVPLAARNLLLTQETMGNLQLFHHSCFTNSIVYADLIFDLPQLSEEELPLVRLFTVLLPQMGCGGRDYKENLGYVQANTGGIKASLALNLQASDCNAVSPSFYIRGKALHRKANKLFPLLYDFATSIDMTDLSRLKEVLLKHYTMLESSLNKNAMKYAINLSSSALNIPSMLVNEWYGLDYYKKIKMLAQNFDQHAEVLVAQLKNLQHRLLCLKNPHIVLTCNSSMYEELKQHSFYGLLTIETKTPLPWKGQYSVKQVPDQGCIIASPIAFIAKVFKTISYTHKDSPALNVAAALFDNMTLHAKVREQGGAYGGGAGNNPLSGTFHFYSYRDPNIASTLQAFEEAIATISSGQFEETDLEEAKLEIMQSLSTPIAPGTRGDVAYGWLREGKTFAERQAFRDRLLALRCIDIVKAVQEHIVPNFEKGAVVVFASKELLQRENELLVAQNKHALQMESI